MPTEVIVTGNMLGNPEQRKIQVKGEDRVITEIRVFSDTYRKDEAGNSVQDEKRSHPTNVTIWNEHLGNAVMKHFKTGTRVEVRGVAYLSIYEAKDSGEPRIDFHIDAEAVNLVPYRVEKIEFAKKRAANEPPADATPAASEVA